MDIAKIAAGRAPPYDLNVIVEIPEGGRPIKYEYADRRHRSRRTGSGRALPRDRRVDHAGRKGAGREDRRGDIIAMRGVGGTLMQVRDDMRARGFWISHKLIANLCARHAAAGECET